jgi:prepilin peptidase CpaA
MTIVDIVFLALGLLTAVAAFIDWRTGHIPNGLVLVGLIVGSALHIVAFVLAQAPDGSSLPMLLLRAAADVSFGLLVCAIGPLVLFRLEAMGGGDVKLLAVIGATAGPALGLSIELLAFILIALYAPVRLAREGQLGRLLESSAALLVNPFLPPERRRPLPKASLTSVPFGPAIFLATLLGTLTSGGLP